MGLAVGILSSIHISLSRGSGTQEYDKPRLRSDIDKVTGTLVSPSTERKPSRHGEFPNMSFLITLPANRYTFFLFTRCSKAVT